MNKQKQRDLILNCINESIVLFKCKVLVSTSGDITTITSENEVDSIDFVVATPEQKQKSGLHHVITEDFTEYDLMDLVDECDRTGHRKIFLHVA